MGGLIILSSTILTTLLWAKLNNPVRPEGDLRAPVVRRPGRRGRLAQADRRRPPAGPQRPARLGEAHLPDRRGGADRVVPVLRLRRDPGRQAPLGPLLQERPAPGQLDLHPHRDLLHHHDQQRGEPRRRHGRPGRRLRRHGQPRARDPVLRGLRDDVADDAGDLGELPAPAAHPGGGRAEHLLRLDPRRGPGLPVVQLLPGPDLHGRHRLAAARAPRWATAPWSPATRSCC